MGIVYGAQCGKVGVGEGGGVSVSVGDGVWELVLVAVTLALCTALKVGEREGGDERL